MLDHDLSTLRDIAIDDNSEWTTATSFDFDADGVPEIVHRGQSEIMIMSALDGSVLARAPCSYGTSSEGAVVVDVNADGQADVLSGCGGVNARLAAWTVEGSPAARQVMNQWHYDVVNVNDDLTIPCHQQDKGVPGLPTIINNSVQQAPMLVSGRGPGERCRCASPPAAGIAQPLPACAGMPILLDGTPSSGCATGLLFRWTDDAGRVACDWSTDTTCAVVAGDSSNYSLTVSCIDDTWCQSTTEIRTSVSSLDEPSALDRRPAAEPLRVRKALLPDTLTLAWEDVRAPSYNVYGGDIADLGPARPQPEGLLCDVATNVADATVAGPGRWLVAVASCAALESSYGRDSFGRERDPYVVACP